MRSVFDVPHAAIDTAVRDTLAELSADLRRVLVALVERSAKSEGWIVLDDLAEDLGLSREGVEAALHTLERESICMCPDDTDKRVTSRLLRVQEWSRGDREAALIEWGEHFRKWAFGVRE